MTHTQHASPIEASTTARPEARADMPSKWPPPILQFGTSRFLQAHVDLFVCEAARRDPSAALGKITVVQTTRNAASHARLLALREHTRFPVHIRGLRHQETIDRRIESDSIAEALHTDDDWPLLRDRIRHDVKVIVSNTGDSGYAVFAEDDASLLEAATAPRGFVAKLVVLLHARYRAGAETITLLPCELVSRNGDVLRDLVVDIALKWGTPPDFIDYLRHRCIWVNALVDRIVSEPIVPIGAVAEPYALWAIERQAGMVLPCRHDSMIVTDDLAHFERLKLFLLNLGHTVLAQCWLDARRSADPHLADATVRDAMHHARWRATLESVWCDEVLPVFDALGQGESASRYLVDVRDRFDNPFLAHRLSDIATHHEQKKQRRFKPVLDLAQALGVKIAHPYLLAALRDREVKA